MAAWSKQANISLSQSIHIIQMHTPVVIVLNQPMNSGIPHLSLAWRCRLVKNIENQPMKVIRMQNTRNTWISNAIEIPVDVITFIYTSRFVQIPTDSVHCSWGKEFLGFFFKSFLRYIVENTLSMQMLFGWRRWIVRKQCSWVETNNSQNNTHF